MLEPMIGKGPFTMLHQLTLQDWKDHLHLWQIDPWKAWDSHQGGYVLALALAFLLPLARMLLRVFISHVSCFPMMICTLMRDGHRILVFSRFQTCTPLRSSISRTCFGLLDIMKSFDYGESYMTIEWQHLKLTFQQAGMVLMLL